MQSEERLRPATAQVLRNHGLEVVARAVNDNADSMAIRSGLSANLAKGENSVLVNLACNSLASRSVAASHRSGRVTKRAISSWSWM